MANKNNLYYWLIDAMQDVPNTVGTVAGFAKNYIDMNNTPWMDKKDKYFHAKANFNAGKHYNILPATILDIGKEVVDIPKKIWFKPNGLTNRQNVTDSLQDLGADLYGFIQGAIHPFGNPQKLLNKYRPEELDPKY